jgi:4-hydroxy-tetrahydrodipicolinate synthase
MEQLMGTGVALVTPFDAKGRIDIKALGHVVEHCIDGGVDYLVALGTTAEAVTMTPIEKRLVMQTISLVNAGRLPLVVGVGGNNTVAVIDELKDLDFMDFEAILSVSPYYNKPTQEGIYQHFRAISKASTLPIILYNVPSRTGSNMLPETTLRLAKDFENIVAIKEASGDMVQIDKILRDKPHDFLMISGDDFTALSTVLAGGSGVISVLGQGTPTAFSRMVNLALQGESESAYDIHKRLLDGMYLIFEEGNPAGVKALLEKLQLCTAYVRLPLVEASPMLKKKIAQFLKSLNVELV